MVESDIEVTAIFLHIVRYCLVDRIDQHQARYLRLQSRSQPCVRALQSLGNRYLDEPMWQGYLEVHTLNQLGVICFDGLKDLLKAGGNNLGA